VADERMDELLSYRDMKFASFLKSDDLVKLKADAKSLELEIAGLNDEKKSLESRIAALQDAQRRLVKFLEQVTS